MNIFIIGPGGVGKSSTGKILAQNIGYKFIDLDYIFLERYGDIGKFIDIYGYEEYFNKNSHLFYKLLEKNKYNTIFAVSSGFMTYTDELTKKHNQSFKDFGVSILLLPSEDIKISTNIIVERQLKRGFNLNKEREIEKFNKRFDLYKQLGDIKVFSLDTPEEISNKIKNKI